MKTALRLSIVIVAIAISSVTVRASSWPVISGQVSGIELCPQAWCGVAVFTGVFKGQVGFFPNTDRHHRGRGAPWTAAGGPRTPARRFPDGVWTLQTLLRKFEGVAAGELCYNGDNTLPHRR